MLIVVRHGRTDANRAGRLLGRLDVGLDDVGRAQAAAIATHVGPVAKVVSSPLERARDTASAWGQQVEVDERWIELDYGRLDGTPLPEVAPEMWSTWRSDVEFAPPEGESLADLGRRVRAAVDDLAGRAREEDVVVVTHVSPIKAAAAHALGVGDETAWRMYVAPGSVTRIAVGSRGLSLHGFNLVDHLPAQTP